MPDVTVPWIDPLGLFDAYARLVTNQKAPCLTLMAKTPNGFIGKGARRSLWMARMQVEDEHELGPVVTFVPQFIVGGGGAWRPLRALQLTRWLKQFDDSPFDPTSDSHVLTMLKYKANVPTGYQSLPEEARTWYEADAHARIRSYLGGQSALYARAVREMRGFTTLVKAHLHPDNSLVPPLDRWERFIPAALADLFFVAVHRVTALFQPLCEFRGRAPEPLSHADDTSGDAQAAYERMEWRRIQRHGFRPTPSFYGKQWSANSEVTNTLFAGIELEMELTPDQTQPCISAMFCVADEFGLPGGGYPERLHIETDGSVAGLEVPLMPHEIHSFHGEEFWRREWKAIVAAGARNTQGTCGMHIHVNAAEALRYPPALLDAVHRRDYLLPNGSFRTTCAFFIDLITGMLAGGNFAFCFQPSDRLHATMRNLLPNQRAGLDVFEVEMQNALAEGLAPLSPAVSLDHLRRTDIPAASVIDLMGNRPVTTAFGRPRNWDGNYAYTDLTLHRKDTYLASDRYRHVNWTNKKTIEFRLFGPHGFETASLDWLNVCTQFVSAIIAYSKLQASQALIDGCAPADTPVRQLIGMRPSWLHRMLLIDAPTTGVNRSGSLNESDRSWRHQLTRAGAVEDTGLLWAYSPPRTTGARHPWLIGIDGPGKRDSDSPRTPYAALVLRAGPLIGNVDINPAIAFSRRAEVYLSIIDLWQQMLAFMRDHSPMYDIALSYLEKEVVPLLPSEAQLARVRHWVTGSPLPAVPAVVRAPAPPDPRLGPRPPGVSEDVYQFAAQYINQVPPGPRERDMLGNLRNATPTPRWIVQRSSRPGEEIQVVEANPIITNE